MARGILSGKSRTPRPPVEASSTPVLTNSAAQSQNNLQDLENGATNGHRTPQATQNFHRPRVAGGQQKHIKKIQPPATGFDFRITVPPAEAVPSPVDSENGLGDNMIGIALGSPRMVDSQNGMSQMQEKALCTVTETPKPQPPPIQRKSSKWRKIGGLFKAKSAMSAAASQPFYQVRTGTEWPAQDSSHSIDYQSQSKPQPQSQANPISNTEVWPCLEIEPESKAKEGEKQNTSAAPNPTPRKGSTATHNIADPGSLLQVDIPDVHLERYSVMFGSLFTGEQHSSLNRRSKTMEDLRAPQAEKAEERPSSPEFPPPRRRATSPTRAKSPSPSFTLFPTSKVSKASKILGSQNLPRGRSPLHRSQTSVAGVRRDTPTPTNEQDSVVLMVHSPPVQRPVSHGPQNSESSVLSSTSIESEDEKMLLKRIKSVKSYVNPKDEPEWEIINKKSPLPTKEETKQKLAQELTLNTELPPSPVSNGSITSSPIMSPLTSAQVRAKQLISPSGSKLAISPADSTRMPLSDNNDDDEDDEDEDEDEEDNEDISIVEPADPEPEPEPLPKVEVSIARSVSVSKGRRQVIVPIRPRGDRLVPDERMLARRDRTPQVMDVHYGHRHGNSQDARIESI